MILKAITQPEYETYLVRSIKNYENELIESGISANVAAINAKETFHNFLPNGKDTPNNYLYYVYDQDVRVGFIWYGFRSKNSAFIYDFFVEETMRGKGYGKKVMFECEKDAKEKGAKEMKLHVFGHNKLARALYESIGYEPTNIQMKKAL